MLHVVSIVILTKFLVLPKPDAKLLWIGNFIPRGDPWPHRAEGIRRLVNKKHTAAQSACRDVDDAGIAKYVIQGFCLGNVLAAFSDHKGELRFVMENDSVDGGQPHGSTRIENRGRRFEE